MAQAQDRYDRMTTAELEQEAAGRSPAVDLSSARTNQDRAGLLRADDEIQGTSPQQGGSGDQAPTSSAGQDASASGRQESGASTEPIRQRSETSDRPGYERAEGRQQPEAGVQPADVAPYNSDADVQARVDAASGTTTATSQPEGDIPPVGGEANQPGNQQ